MSSPDPIPTKTESAHIKKTKVQVAPIKVRWVDPLLSKLCWIGYPNMSIFLTNFVNYLYVKHIFILSFIF